MLKTIAKKILTEELFFLSQRLKSAEFALDRIEQDVVHIGQDAPAEAHELAQKILTRVLTSADKVRTGAVEKVHDWEVALYKETWVQIVQTWATKWLAATKDIFE